MTQQMQRSVNTTSSLDHFPRDTSLNNTMSTSQHTHTHRKRSVQISDSSMVWLYPEDPSYRKNKAYTAADRKASVERALIDAVHIRRILHSSESNKNSGLSIKDTLKLHGIENENLLGIEHLVLEDPRRVKERKRAHQKVILMEQDIQEKTGIKNSGRLAQLSVILTRKPASEARSRAAMAA